MSNKLAELRALAEQEALESGVDMNVAVSGGSSRLLPVGYALGRVVEYIEYGMQPQLYNGVAKEPALEYSFGFALWGTAPNGETYHDAATNEPHIIRTYNQAQSRNEKAGAFKLFKALNWKNNKTNFAQFIGEPFLVKILHKEKSKTDKTIVSRIDPAGFLPPIDPVTQQPYGIPEAADKLYRMFIWGRPTKEAWDALYVEGVYEAKDGKPAASKNRIQEQILGALDFQGSPLQQLLLSNGVTTLPSAPLALPTAAVPVALPLAVPAVPAVPGIQPPTMVALPVTSVTTSPISQVPVAVPLVVAPVAVAAPAVVPVGVPAIAIPAVPQLAVPSSPVLPV